MREIDDGLLWRARAQVYGHWVRTTHPPTVAQAAEELGAELEDVVAAWRELDRRHALFLDPGTTAIRMAHPFSAVATLFRVQIGERGWWANCAWDAFGIPAALHCDAGITATCSDTQEVVSIDVRDGVLTPDTGRVHFALPYRRWYDDLVRT